MNDFVERAGDMGQGTKLRLLKDGDGDIHVSVMPENDRIPELSIEFCNSGTKSYRTVLALHDLYRAMEADNLERGDNET